MKKSLVFICFFVLTLLISKYGYAQNKPSPLVGRWVTKDRTTIEFMPCGSGACGKQVAAEREKDKKANGKTIAQDVIAEKDNSFTGLVFDPDNGKSYKATWVLSDDGKTLMLKVKWGIMSFNEDWRRVR